MRSHLKKYVHTCRGWESPGADIMVGSFGYIALDLVLLYVRYVR